MVKELYVFPYPSQDSSQSAPTMTKKFWIPAFAGMTVEAGMTNGVWIFHHPGISRPCQLRWRDCSSCASGIIECAHYPTSLRS